MVIYEPVAVAAGNPLGTECIYNLVGGGRCVGWHGGSDKWAHAQSTESVVRLAGGAPDASSKSGK